MSKVLFKDGNEKLVDEKQLQHLLNIKNAKRDQIFTYINEKHLDKIRYVWSNRLEKWLCIA